MFWLALDSPVSQSVQLSCLGKTAVLFLFWEDKWKLTIDWNLSRINLPSQEMDVKDTHTLPSMTRSQFSITYETSEKRDCASPRGGPACVLLLSEAAQTNICTKCRKLFLTANRISDFCYFGYHKVCELENNTNLTSIFCLIKRSVSLVSTLKSW